MRKDCCNCKYEAWDYVGAKPCDKCYASKDAPTMWEAGGNYVPQTNADRIRAMSDEELAKWMSCGATMSVGVCGYCKNSKLASCEGIPCEGKTDAEIILEWLQQPSEGE